MTATVASDPAFLAGGGEMGARIRAMDWRATPLGPVQGWPAALRTLVGLMLASNQPMYIAWGPQRAFLYNDEYAPFLGTKHPAALGRDVLAEVWPEIRADIEPLLAATMAGDPVRVPRMQLFLERNGYSEETWFSFFFAPVRGEGGTVEGVFGACNDLTAQVHAERDLAARSARHRDVLANMSEAFVLMDHAFHVIDANAAALRLSALDAERMLGHCHWDLFPATFDSPLGRMYRRVMADGGSAEAEHLHVFPGGRQAWFEVRAHRVQSGICAFFHDITARRSEAEAAALASERVQLALDAGAILGTWVWTVEDDHLVADERFAQTFGLDPQACREGVPPREAFAAIHPEDQARLEAASRDALATGGRFRCEYRVQRPDGECVWVEANGRVELGADGRPVRFPGVLVACGERRRIEAERDRSATLLRAFIEAVPGVVYAKDLEGRLILGNRGVADLLGVPPEQYLGRTDLELLADAAQAGQVMANDRRIMDSGVVEQVEEDIRQADGFPATWLSTKAPMRDAAGHIVGLIGTSLDITERRRMVARLEDDDRRKDEFLAMLAHELRNPLAPIGTASELLRLVPGDAARVAELARIIQRQVGHMTELVDDLLEVSRVTRGLVEYAREPVDLLLVLVAAIEQVEPVVRGRGHALVTESSGSPALVIGDRNRLVQVVANLLNNAAKYTPEGGRIAVLVDASQDVVTLRVRDNGNGMDARLLSRVFDLFAQAERTPDRSQGGLGIGLALVRSIVEAHGGRIVARSDGLGQGSEFVVTLPLAPAGTRVAVEAPAPPREDAPRRTVLVVDDNRDAAETLASALRLLRHEVSVATGARQAIALAGTRDDWDAFILDIGMPDMTGHELAGVLRDMPAARDARFIALSGYGHASDRAASRAAGFDHHLVKPADIDRIQALLRGDAARPRDR